MAKPVMKFGFLTNIRAKIGIDTEKVTVTSTGSLHVDPSKLLETAEAKVQIKALEAIASGHQSPIK